MKTKSTHITVSIALLLIAFNAQAQNWLTTGNSGTNSNTNFLGTKDGASFVLRTNNVERMRISYTGRVGIGTKSPRQALDVHGGLTADSFYIGNSKTLYYNGDLQLDAHGSTVDIGNINQDETGLFVNSAEEGIVGVASGLGVAVGGITQSTDPRTFGAGVLGKAYAPNTFGGDFENTSGPGIYCVSDSNYGIYAAGGAYAGYFNGNVYSTGNYTSSDETLKQNVQDFSTALNIINQLHPKTYQYRQDKSYKLMKLPQGQHYGLIAQDVEKVLPDLVKETKFNVDQATPHTLAFNPKNPGKKINFQASNTGEVINFKALNYTELIPILIKGMQEQQQSIEELKQEVDQLKNLLAANLSKPDVSSVETTNLSSAVLLQNVPNPYKNSTTISYNLPTKFLSAQIIITDNTGKVLKQTNLHGTGKGSINIDASSLLSGSYNYSLSIDGRLIDTKQMLVQK